MNIRALRVFTSIMDESTLSRAAARLHMSESAASRQLQLLEHSLKAVLFARNRKRLEPTAAAEALLPDALRILSQIDSLPALVEAVGKEKSRPLRIVCHARVLNALVLPAIVRLMDAVPGIAIKLDLQPRRDLGRRMMQGLFDIGVSALPSPTDGLDPIILGNSPLGVLVAKGHALATAKFVTTSDIAPLPYIALDDTTVIRRMIDATLEANGQRLRVVCEVATGDAAYRLVRAGQGFTFADKIALDPELDGLVLIPWTQPPDVSYGLFLGQPTKHPAVPMAVEILRAVFERQALASAN